LKRENVLNGKTYKIRTGCGAMYVTVNITEEGVPIEVFINLGKAGDAELPKQKPLGD
jgi:hypothetical protein